MPTANLPTRRPRAAVLLAVVIALILAGCAAPSADREVVEGSVEPSTEPSAQSEPEPGADPEPVAEPEPTAAEPAADGPLAFNAVDLNGANVDLAEFSGEPVVLWFWAPWCSICRGEGPHVADVAAALDGDVTFVGVAGLGEVSAMETFVADTGTAGFTHLVDDDGSLWQRFGVTYQPAYAFIGPTGLVSVSTGALGPDELMERAEALI